MAKNLRASFPVRRPSPSEPNLADKEQVSNNHIDNKEIKMGTTEGEIKLLTLISSCEPLLVGLYLLLGAGSPRGRQQMHRCRNPRTIDESSCCWRSRPSPFLPLPWKRREDSGVSRAALEAEGREKIEPSFVGSRRAGGAGRRRRKARPYGHVLKKVKDLRKGAKLGLKIFKIK